MPTVDSMNSAISGIMTIRTLPISEMWPSQDFPMCVRIERRIVVRGEGGVAGRVILAAPPEAEAGACAKKNRTP
ncbi:hypothetical protein GCM10023144_15020 [Pigmentiphaga soli]|uniref:Uncharacterized protein n=1 Tax=Pigmentiphaga soli TaxID=1007095 RepID=A0ABP8GRB7_9BURK